MARLNLNQLKIHVVLLGFMGTGKTHSGQILSNMMNVPCYDTDKIIVSRTGMNINDIFKHYGENYFRDQETDILTKLVNEKSPCIITTGGGIVIREHNWYVMDKNSVTFSLLASPKTIYDRLKYDETRPLLNTNDKFLKIKQLLINRLEYYEKGDHLIWTDKLTPQEVANQIYSKLYSNGYMYRSDLNGC
ncbi:shikimate kinase [Natranaerobius thermophilus]|uniref:Shikimate kinase n=1 Tax=Natranaerobius thermophilus (strain ATCC BAA-1301 / DSM 18059 / JW/NM-WN-LF) TaxID=457570 RepID=B2A553_NATTJ|nr:shikimate kinase [Natranaerobius thermophilus]ACB85295.1 Shikimate kinase [Natranaerobius thermophilus JW/NM-WN-LF]